MRIALLGPVELSHDGRRIRLNGSKQLALLALLALNADRLLPVDHIVDALWGDDEAGDAINALQHQISRLRAAIGREQVSFHGSGYSLQIPADAVDVRRFEHLATEGRTGLRLGDGRVAATTCARLSVCGVGRRWAGSPATRGYWPSLSGWRIFGWM